MITIKKFMALHGRSLDIRCRHQWSLLYDRLDRQSPPSLVDNNRVWVPGHLTDSPDFTIPDFFPVGSPKKADLYEYWMSYERTSSAISKRLHQILAATSKNMQCHVLLYLEAQESVTTLFLKHTSCDFLKHAGVKCNYFILSCTFS